MGIEERMVAELQTTANGLKYCHDNKFTTFINETEKTLDTQIKFVEAVTGKKVEITDWVVRLV